MATITVSGTIVGREGEPVVTQKTLGSDFVIYEFSVLDTEYYGGKKKDDRGQFYKVQVTGRQGEFLVNSLERRDFVSVTGQLVQREYNDKLFLDIKNARVNQPYKERKEAGGDSLF